MGSLSGQLARGMQSSCARLFVIFVDECVNIHADRWSRRSCLSLTLLSGHYEGSG